VFGDGLVMMQPYRPGRVPVVLVHGTASSPARWADIVNEVQNDPQLAERVQIWLFNYNTSNPILYSASLLREALVSAVRDFDPEGRDPALRDMVVMGHSQGGLLTRLAVTESGTRFWDAFAKVPFAEIRGMPEERALLQKVAFFEPLPFVTRVVFMATPHRGSYRVTGPVLNVVRRLVTLPARLATPVENLVRLNPGAYVADVAAARGLPTAVDNMSPANRFIRALGACPIAPGVAVHSIVAVDGKGDVRALSDGVVRYESAHLPGVGSEKVVRSPHSMQSQPETILEVRRILREHLGIP
jgi:pimeloyl-ACP methyl ester carboxylesterase